MNSQLTLDIRLRDDATFDNFIGNAAMRIQGNEPVHYLWGPAGSGKSHLLQALCHQSGHQASSHQASGNHVNGNQVNGENSHSIYLENLKLSSAELIQSLEAFSLICLDDVDEILGDENWELALLHLLNSVKEGESRLVLSASVPAAQLQCRLPDLDSRLKALVAIETGIPGDEDKLVMLQARANNRGFQLGDEVAQFILGRAPRDMCHLIDLLERLEVESLRQQKMVTIPFVKKTLNL